MHKNYVFADGYAAGLSDSRRGIKDRHMNPYLLDREEMISYSAWKEGYEAGWREGNNEKDKRNNADEGRSDGNLGVQKE